MIASLHTSLGNSARPCFQRNPKPSFEINTEIYNRIIGFSYSKARICFKIIRGVGKEMGKGMDKTILAMS